MHRTKHNQPSQATRRARMWGTAISHKLSILKIINEVVARCGVVGKATAAELIALTKQTTIEFHTSRLEHCSVHVTTTNVTYWGTVLGSKEGIYVLCAIRAVSTN